MLVAQSHLTLCNPMDCSPPGSSGHGILQARILKWVAISFFSWSRDRTQVSCTVEGFLTIWPTREARKSRRIPKEHLLPLHWLHYSFWLCGPQQIVENSERDRNNRPLYLPPENLYASQEATVRTRHETTGWFKIGKWIPRDYILSPCLLNWTQDCWVITGN